MTATINCAGCQHAYIETALFCPNCGRPKVREAQADPLLGKLLGERFLVQEQLGQGGSGTIYRAEHVTLRRKVAIKVLHTELSRDDLAVERFRREATTVAEIDNEHIVEIHDFGRTPDGRLYLAMELLEGETLDGVLARDRTLSIERAADVLIQVGEALMEAHAIGYVHRDLRPRNIYLAVRRGKANFIKLLDFGLAKLVETEGQAASTSLGMTFGDPRYMSPEQARGDRIDRRADIYQLGCVAYEMLTGAPPFGGNRVFDILTKQVTEVPQPLPSLRRGVPLWMEAAVTKMLAKDADNRFATTTRMVEALRRGLETGEVMEDEVARRRESIPPPSVSRVMQRMGLPLPEAIVPLPPPIAVPLPPQPAASPPAPSAAAPSAMPPASSAPAPSAMPPASSAAVPSAMPPVSYAAVPSAMPPASSAAMPPAAQVPGAYASPIGPAPSVPSSPVPVSGPAPVLPSSVPAPSLPVPLPAAQTVSPWSSPVRDADPGSTLKAPSAPPPGKPDSVELLRKRTGTPRVGVPIVEAPADAIQPPVAGVIASADPPKASPRAPSQPVSITLDPLPARAPSQPVVPLTDVKGKRPSASDLNNISQVWYDEGDQLAGDDEPPARRTQRARRTISPSATDVSYYDEDRPRRRGNGGIYAAIGVFVGIGGVMAFALTRGSSAPTTPALREPAIAAVVVDAAPSTILPNDPADSVAPPTAPGPVPVPVAVTPAPVAPAVKPPAVKPPTTPAPTAPKVTPRTPPVSFPVPGADAIRRPAGTGLPAPTPAPVAPPEVKPPVAPSLTDSPKDPYGSDDAPTDAVSPEKKAEFFANLGGQQLLGGDTAGAAANFKKAVELDARNAAAVMGLGEIALRQGLFGDAIAHLSKAAKLSPRNAKPLTLLGEAYLNSGNNQQAAAQFKKALLLDPDNARARDGYNEASSRVPPPDDETP
jgi:serine/threonine-protein kinase